MGFAQLAIIFIEYASKLLVSHLSNGKYSFLKHGGVISYGVVGLLKRPKCWDHSKYRMFLVH